jgi:NTE family protein
MTVPERKRVARRPAADVVAASRPAIGPVLGPAIGLALGGGAARGLGHIPVLEAFDELGVRPAIIAGTSIGAILGSIYASGMPAREMREFAMKLFANRAEVLKRIAQRWPGALAAIWNPFTPAMFNGETIIDILQPEGMPLLFEQLRIPFMAVATDFYTEEQVVFDAGPLLPAVAASAALPALLKPVQIGERVLIDGGFVNPTPFDLIKGHCDVVVAVDVTGDIIKRPGRTMPTSLETWIGAAQITLHSIVREKLKFQAPDILIRPDVGGFGGLDFTKIEDILKASLPAKEATKRQLAAVIEDVAKGRPA